MSLRPGDYGIVKVIHGEHKGRIGYYDDDDSFPLKRKYLTMTNIYMKRVKTKTK